VNQPTLLMQSLAWLISGWPLRLLLLLVFVMASSIGVILVSHETRALYGRLQVEEHVGDNLDSEYERLLLEQSAWAGYHRIDQLAREELQMRSPNQSSLVLMRRAPRIVQTASAVGEQQ
jgi:cell division protein FtsL